MLGDPGPLGVVVGLHRHHRGQPDQSQVVIGSERAQRPGQQRDGGCRPVQTPGDQAAQEQPRDVVPGWRSARGLGGEPQFARAQPPRPQTRAERSQVGLPRGRRIQVDEPLRRGEQRGSGTDAGVHHERHLRAQPCHVSPPARTQRTDLGRRQQVRDERRRAGIQARLRSRQGTDGPLPGVGGQRCGALEEGGGRRPAAAGQGSAGGPLQLVGDVLIGACRRVRPVPGPSVRVLGGIDGLRERSVHVAQQVGVGRAPARGADQWVSEPDARTEFDQPALLGRRRCRGPDALSLQGPPEQWHVAERLDRGGQQEPTGVVRQGGDAPLVAVLHPIGDRGAAGEAEAEGELRRREPARQLDQGQRVAAGLCHDPVPHPVVDWPGEHRVQQVARIGVRQPAHVQLGQAGEQPLVAGAADSEDERDRLGL